MKKPSLLVISQVYVPDSPAVGQYMHEVAREIVGRGYQVRVLTSARGYENPSVLYAKRETIDGVYVRRLPLSSFGKKSIKVRLLGQSLFLLQVILRGLFMRRLDRILVSTSPPMASTAAVIIQFFRRVPITFWAMDINPDQIVAMGQAREGSFIVRIFDWINRTILKKARGVVALDRFMAARLEAKYPVGDRMAIIPPWPLESHLESADHAHNPFRKKHGLCDKFVIMYSGNISPAHPITTILEAANRIQDDPRIVFLFIGGGNGKKRIDEFIEREKIDNVRTLPYQPLDQIKYSLSAADVHLVAMGTEMVGIVHPCKVYGAMAVARPILLLGPMESHVGELLESHDIGWQIDHNDVAKAEACIRHLVATAATELTRKGELGKQLIEQELSKKFLCGKFCEVVEWN